MLLLRHLCSSLFVLMLSSVLMDIVVVDDAVAPSLFVFVCVDVVVVAIVFRPGCSSLLSLL